MVVTAYLVALIIIFGIWSSVVYKRTAAQREDKNGD
jgi:hypothetical protein